MFFLAKKKQISSLKAETKCLVKEKGKYRSQEPVFWGFHVILVFQGVYVFQFPSMPEAKKTTTKPNVHGRCVAGGICLRIWLDETHTYLRSTPHPVTVTTRIITFLVGNPYKPSFATVTGWGVDPTPINLSVFEILVFPPENVHECRAPEKEPFEKKERNASLPT